MGCTASVADSSPLSPEPRASDNQRLSVVSLQLPVSDDDAMSSSSVPSMEPPSQPSNGMLDERICNTEIRIRWVVKRLAEHFPINEQPQWIAERLNRKSANEVESSTVIRLTFAWDSEDARLPHTAVIKIPLSKEAREDERGRFYYTLFKRECNAFEWLQKLSDFACPTIYHIKKHGNEEGGAGIVMEDLGERAQQQEHGLAIADLPVSFFANEAGSFPDILEFFSSHGADPNRIKKIEKYFNATYLESTVNESCEELNSRKVLVHGEPFSSNIFVDIVDDDAHPVAAIVDWTSCHAGCFGEDLAKTICWNLSMKERSAQTSSLLQAYHYQLVLQSGKSSIMAEMVRAAYEKFVPVATVSFVHKVMLLRERSDIDPLIERAKSLINQVYHTVRIQEELFDDDKNNNVEMLS